MTTVSRPNKDALTRALDILRDAMRPFIVRNLRSIPGGRPDDRIRNSLERWTPEDYRAHAATGHNDVESLLDINNFPILIRDYWRDTFRNALGNDMSVQNALWQIKEARNQASHPSTQDIDPEFARAHLFHIIDVLGKIGRPNERTEVERIRDSLFAAPPPTTLPDAMPPPPDSPPPVEPPQRPQRPSTTLAPWREVVRINQDVAQGDFSLAEFAADLQQVHDGRADATQYGNPVSFFNHTYITPGIRTLLVNTLRRLAGNGGEPVIQTKTGFGGGKTHSLIALYHLVQNASLLINPAGDSEDARRPSEEIRGMMLEAGLDPDEWQGAKVAVLDCVFLSPTSSKTTEKGDPLNTLWGEMAYQLGGQEGYDIVGEAARQGTAPAGQLDELFEYVGPCVILIDELVAYIRNTGNAIDSNYTFVQNLTQAARRSGRVSLVITLPEHAVEAGGELGAEVLARLDSILGRIEATWEPLEIYEAFEVVRRRLFGALSDSSERDRTCEAFSRIYSQNRSEYPQGVSEQVYLQRMKDCYPIHPEIFDRLYSDWSSIARFQRTRGVLRMMAACISRLNLRNDPSPLIMPASLTLDDPALSNEFVNLLAGNWSSVMSEVDSNDSRTDAIDKSVRRFADVGGASRRIARTIFLGSAPTGSFRGIDMRQIRLGTVQPGHGVAAYNEAIGRITTDLYHLYSADGRYYFHVEENLNKVAADRAGTVTAREVAEQVRKAMQEAVVRRSDVIVFPQSSADVPDADSVRLVMLPYDKSLPSRASEDDYASAFALNLLMGRGSAPRVRKNTLLFLAARRDEVRQLDTVVRNYLAWDSIRTGERSIDNLEGERRTQVYNSVRRYDTELRAALVNAYRWTLAPSQPDPQDSSRLSFTRSQISAQDTGQIVESAFAKFLDEEALADKISPDALQSILERFVWPSAQYQDHIGVDDLWHLMTANVYMQRLRNKSVLMACVRAGVSDSKFGYAESYTAESEDQYQNLSFGEDAAGIAERGSGLLVNAEMAKLVIEQQGEERREEPPGGQGQAGSGTTGVGVGVTNTGEQDVATPTSTPMVTRIMVNKTVQGQLSLDDISPMRDEIIRTLLDGGGEVTVSVTISAANPNGFAENIARAIRENSEQLGLVFEEGQA